MIRKLAVALTLLTLIIFAPMYCRFGDVALAQAAQQSGAQDVVYACPMHPEVTSKNAGRCPKCGMDLRINKRARLAHTSSASIRTKSSMFPEPTV